MQRVPGRPAAPAAARPRRCAGSSSRPRLHPADLILPMFVKEGIAEPAPIPSMPGVVQHTRDSLRKAAHEAVEAGVGGLILFGVPAAKDGRGSGADDPAGDRPAGAAASWRPRSATRTVLMADLCLDEYTDHGHCGVLTAVRRRGQRRHADPLRRRSRWRRPRAGAQVVAPERDDGRPGRRDPVRRSTGPASPTSRSWPTRRSTRPASTARSGTRPSARRSSATGRRTSRTRRDRRPRRCARWRWTWPRARTSVMVKPALAVPGRASRAVRDAVDRAGGGLPGLRRVRDGRGGRRERLDRPGPDDHRDADRRSAGPART